MHASHWWFTRLATVVTLGLSLFPAACTAQDPIFTGLDAQVPPGTALLIVNRDGTSTGMVTSNTGGINCGATCSAAFELGTTVTLTATPATGSTFIGWSGGGCSGTGMCVVTVTAAVAVTATFKVNDYTLAVAKNGTGTGTGTVTSWPAGINCGADCAEIVNHGTTMMLIATPATGSTFIGWSGGGCSGTGMCVVSVTAAMAVTATFKVNAYTLAVVKNGSGSGSVTSSPAGINCGTDCAEIVNHGTTMTLTATPATSSTFSGWSGGGCSGTGTCVVTVTSATSVTASFALIPYTLSVTIGASGGTGTVTSSPAGINCGTDCSEVYNHGTSVTLTATPAVGSTFSYWSGGGCSGTSTCTLTVTSTTSVTATFTRCGDGVCTGGEDCDSCSMDCGSCPYCGDGGCNGGETCESCPIDCIPTGGNCP
jgi:Divergent InlB B-repeat domain